MAYCDIPRQINGASQCLSLLQNPNLNPVSGYRINPECDTYRHLINQCEINYGNTGLFNGYSKGYDGVWRQQSNIYNNIQQSQQLQQQQLLQLLYQLQTQQVPLMQLLQMLQNTSQNTVQTVQPTQPVQNAATAPLANPPVSWWTNRPSSRPNSDYFQGGFGGLVPRYAR
jgi:hypothetical protein